MVFVRSSLGSEAQKQVYKCVHLLVCLDGGFEDGLSIKTFALFFVCLFL